VPITVDRSTLASCVVPCYLAQH